MAYQSSLNDKIPGVKEGIYSKEYHNVYTWICFGHDVIYVHVLVLLAWIKLVLLKSSCIWLNHTLLFASAQRTKRRANTYFSALHIKINGWLLPRSVHGKNKERNGSCIFGYPSKYDGIYSCKWLYWEKAEVNREKERVMMKQY